MSYRIEYQYRCFVEPVTDHLHEQRYVIAVEGGDNNLISPNGRRARSWDAAFIGTTSQVLKSAVYLAGACEGGCLKPLGRDCSPESYIRRIRRLLDQPHAPYLSGYWYAQIEVKDGHPAVEHARGLGLEMRSTTRYGDRRVAISCGPDRRHLVFDFADRFPDIPAWSLAQVGGLPSS